jgi:hypothetical protein
MQFLKKSLSAISCIAAEQNWLSILFPEHRKNTYKNYIIIGVGIKSANDKPGSGMNFSRNLIIPKQLCFY